MKIAFADDTDSTPLVITIGLTDTGNEDPILNSKHGDEENLATDTTSVEPIEDLPATQLPGMVEDHLLLRAKSFSTPLSNLQSMIFIQILTLALTPNLQLHPRRKVVNSHDIKLIITDVDGTVQTPKEAQR